MPCRKFNRENLRNIEFLKLNKNYKMSLITLWVSFIILVSIFPELNLFYYLLYNFLILLFTLIHNYIKPSQISFNAFFLFSSFPSLIICYITLIYENFLLITILEYITVRDTYAISKLCLRLFKKRFFTFNKYYQLDFRIPLI